MIDPSDKKMLYWLIDQYLLKNISDWSFADAYYKSFCLEIDENTLTKKEAKAFSALEEVASRFTNIEEDLKNYPGVYYTPAELHEKIIETKEALKECWITVDHP